MTREEKLEKDRIKSKKYYSLNKEKNREKRNEHNRKYRKTHGEYFRKYMAEYRKTHKPIYIHKPKRIKLTYEEKRTKRMERYYGRYDFIKEKINTAKRNEYRKNPYKYKTQRWASGIINYAVKTGKVEKLNCVMCGSVKSEAHHPNYNLPLTVIWLCHKHHKELHRLINKSNELPNSNGIKSLVPLTFLRGC